MNGKMIGTKPLYVALAQRKDVRRQALESQMQQRASQRVAYGGGSIGGPGYMGQPVYGYPPMPGYGGQPGMMPGMRSGPMMGYPPQQMMQARPRYAPNGQPGMPMPYGMPPPQMSYPGMPPNYPVRPGNVGGARPPTAAPNATGRSPVGMPQGLPAGAAPRGQMPVRPQQQGFPEAAQAPGPRLNAQSLARASPAEQKQMLGESLYPLIHE